MSPAASPTSSESGLREAMLEIAGKLLGERADPRRGLGAGGGAGGAAGDLVGKRGISLERPPRADFGDYSTNAALLLAPLAGGPPRELAQRLGEAVAERLGGQLERFEVAGPGFLNLFLSDRWHLEALAGALAASERFGAGGAGSRQRTIVEFVSANPTGPLHVGHARNAAYGDALARVLSFHGHDVEREFYVNDAGTQIRKLGESIQALARGEQPPPDGYRGDYVHDLVERLPDAVQDADPMRVGRAAVTLMLERIERALARFNVVGFDRWQSESALHESREELRGSDGAPLSPVAHALELLEERGCTYTKDGALWLKSSDYGDDKDRVLVRSTGEHTYFASDIAYHQDKRERGFERQIDVWGADHHGYMARMRAAYEALGGDPDELEMLIMQLVHLVRRGERAQMSKRSGEFVTLEDLIDEIGVDAARWFLLSRSHDTAIDLDLDLAREQSSENPVYYVQYAHARIASMLAKAGEQRERQALDDLLSRQGSEDVPARPRRADARAGQLPADALVGHGPADALGLHPAERTLVKRLIAFPGEVEEAAARRAPHRIASYALALAQDFTAFYRDCRVLGAEPLSVESLRIALCVATQRTIARSLELLGVSAPSEM